MDFSYMKTWANNRYTLEQKLKLEFRISCPEIGYAEHEARFLSIEEWELWSNDEFSRRLTILRQASEGAY